MRKALVRVIIWAVACTPGMLPIIAAAQSTPVAISLELYDKDKLDKGFADGLRQAVQGDSRFTLTETVPPDGLKLKMTDGLKPMENDLDSVAAYEVSVKLGSGKFLRTLTGLCDQNRLEMCGRVVAEDAYNTYADYMARHKPKT